MDKFIVSSLFYGLFAFYILSGCLCIGKTNAEDDIKEIECFNCSSDFLKNGDSDPCILGVNSLQTQICKGKNMACVKVYTKMYQISSGGVNWEKSPTVVSRFCDTPLEYDIGCTDFDANKGTQNICFCDTDKCNGASHVALSASLVLIVSLAALLMF